jgi:hypothetical protein
VDKGKNGCNSIVFCTSCPVDKSKGLFVWIVDKSGLFLNREKVVIFHSKWKSDRPLLF